MAMNIDYIRNYRNLTTSGNGWNFCRLEETSIEGIKKFRERFAKPVEFNETRFITFGGNWTCGSEPLNLKWPSQEERL